MSNEKLNTEIIALFLSGQMSKEELSEFNKRLQSDNDLQKEVYLQELIVNSIQEAGRRKLRTHLAEIHEKQLETTTKEELIERDKNRIYSSRWLYLGIAASLTVILLLGLVKIFNKPTGDKLYAEYYSPFPNVVYPTIRSSNTVADKKAEAFAAYDKKEYALAIKIFNELINKEHNEIVLFYLGSAYLANNQVDEAINSFKKYLTMHEEFKSDALWYLSLCYINTANFDEAKKPLGTLITHPNAYTIKARELLDKL